MAGPAVLAHRGAWSDDPGGAPQNSLEAVRRALALGADGVEIDVRRTVDGVLALQHDPVVAKVGPGGLLAGVVLAEERMEDLVGLDRLEMVLEVAASADRPFTVNVEIKSVPDEPGWDPSERLARDAAELVGRYRPAARSWLSPPPGEPAPPGRLPVVLSSFSLAAIDAVRETAPALATGLLTSEGDDQLEALARAAEHGHVAVHPPHVRVTGALVAAAHERGMAMLAWTADDAARGIVLAGMGVDAVITNRPAALLGALRTRLRPGQLSS